MSGAGDERVGWIDVARGIGILLVVYGHAIRGLTASDHVATPAILLQDSLIYSFHMPFFFVLAGLFAGRSTARGLSGFIGSRLASVVWPYLLWSLLQGAMQVLASGMVNNPIGWESLISILWEPIGQFWFLYALLLCQLMLLLPRPLLYLSVPVMLAVRAGFDDGTILFRAMADLPFFAAGVWLGGSGATRLTDGWRAIAALLGGVVLFAVAYVMKPHLPGPVWHIVFRLALGFGGSVAVLGAARLLSSRDMVLRRLGAASMPIYLMHVIASAVVRIVLNRLYPAMPLAGALFLVTLAGICLPYIAWRIADRMGLSPWLGFGRARGGVAAKTGTRVAELA